MCSWENVLVDNKNLSSQSESSWDRQILTFLNPRLNVSSFCIDHEKYVTCKNIIKSHMAPPEPIFIYRSYVNHHVCFVLLFIESASKKYKNTIFQWFNISQSTQIETRSPCSEFNVGWMLKFFRTFEDEIIVELINLMNEMLMENCHCSLKLR